MEVVVKLHVKEESVPEGKDIHSYIREELGWLEESGIFPEAIMPAKTEEESYDERDFVAETIHHAEQPH